MQEVLTSEIFLLSSVFGAILLGAFGVAGLLRRDPASRRFGGATGSGEKRREHISLSHTDSRPIYLRALEPLQRAVAQTDPAQVKLARSKMIEAGYYQPSAVETYFTFRVILGIGLAAGVGFFLFFFSPQIVGTRALFIILGFAAFGYYFPAFFITSRINERRKKFKLGIPDGLDMLLVGVEAGLSIPASMKHIVDEFADTHPVVAEQFQIVVLEFQAGRSRADALKNLSKRMNLPETRTLASMIVQAESLGTSMAQTLRVMADELRAQRMLEAEKKAAELPVKMSIPLVCCIFPSLMAVALVPAVLQTTEFFNSISAG